jgi:hypothetical protein
MRKIQQIATVAAAVGGLAGLGTGTAIGDTGTHNPQQQGPLQTAPQQAPQGHPQQAPQQAPQTSYSTEANTSYVNRPAMQCSSETLAEVNVPIAILRPAQTSGFSCEQENAAFNRY